MGGSKRVMFGHSAYEVVSYFEHAGHMTFLFKTKVNQPVCIEIHQAENLSLCQM